MPVPSLESLIAQHELVDEVGYARGCSCGDGYTPLFDHPAHVAEVIREAHTVRTLDELNNLPSGTVVMDVDGAALRKNPYKLSSDLQRWYPAWTEGNAYERDMGIDADMVDLPALVIWTSADGAEDQQ